MVEVKRLEYHNDLFFHRVKRKDLEMIVIVG
jgi:hypothetical protein